jgi:hypothetical protein
MNEESHTKSTKVTKTKGVFLRVLGGLGARPLLFVMPLVFTQPVQFAEAAQRRAVQTILPTSLGSAELERISADILERSLFSARTMNAEYLQKVSDVLDRYLRGELDLATARLELKQKLAEIGYAPAPGDEETLRDLSSDERINLVIRTNAEMARGYGTWLQGQQAPILDRWPAQELYRAFNRKVPRNWIKRWSDAGGEFYGGRMIALKNTDLWIRISRFGTPYPPFDFNSGMWIKDIDRETAMSLGLIDRDTQIAPQTRDFNQDLKFSPDIRAEALRQALIDEGYQFDGDVLTP